MKTASAYSFIRFDVDADTYVYGRIIGHMGRVVDPTPIQTPGKIQTSGSSVSVTATTALTLPFAPVAVGDIIVVAKPDGTTDVRSVATKTDGDNITVDTAVNWSGGYVFSWLKAEVGAATTNGWIDVEGAELVTITIKWEQGDLATTLDYVIEARDGSMNQTPIQVDSGTIALAVVGTSTGRIVEVQTAGYSSLRVGLKRTGADTSDAGAAIEIVDVTLNIGSSTP